MLQLSLGRGARASRRPVGVARGLALLFLLWMGVSQSSWAAGCTSPMTAHIASGGTAVFSPACSPAGFDNASGELHGTVDTGSTFGSLIYTNNGDGATSDTFTALADDGATLIRFNITIDPAAPVVVVSPGSLANPVFGQAYTGGTLSATGGTAPYAFSITAGSLPSGMGLSGNTISGTPTSTGAYSVTIHVSDNAGHATDKSYSITIADPTLVITPATLPAAQQGRAYTAQTLSSSGGTAPYTYQLASGSSLPTGLSLDSNGVVSGTPTVAGNFSFSVVVTDSTIRSGGGHVSSTQALSIQVAVAPTINIAPASLSGATYGVAYGPQTLIASGGTAPYTFTYTGTLPSGVSLVNGVLSGTPTLPGTFNFTVTATDANSFPGSRSYSVSVAAAKPGAPTGVTATAASGAPTDPASAVVSFTAPADNGGAPISQYMVTSSAGGLTATGAGSPITVPGLTRGTSYTFTVTATNTAGTSDPSMASAPVTPTIIDAVQFSNPGAQNFGTAPTLTASSTSGRTPTFASTTSSVCSVNSGAVLTFASAGSCSITASVVNNGTYEAASQSQTFQVNAVAPGAPTIGPASSPLAPQTQPTGTASVSFTPPAGTGGQAITQYIVTATEGGTFTATGSGSPITVTGLAYGTQYKFAVKADNGSFQGALSASSNAVTPIQQQSITFPNPGTLDFGTTTPLNATASSGLDVALVSGTTNVCQIVPPKQVHAIAPGTCTITASQGGDAGHQQASDVPQTFLIRVPGGAVSIATTSLLAPTRGVPYSQTIVVNGGAQPYTFQETGTLPNGITFNAGVFSGLATQAGTYSFSVTVTDAASQTASQNYSFTVISPAFVITPATLPAGKVAVAYTSTTLATTGGLAPYTYTVTSGALPAGLTLSPAGTISGTPTQSGPASLTITATDRFNGVGSQAYSITVGDAVPVVVGSSYSTGANNPVTMPVTTNHTGGPINSIAISRAPTHGAATVNGLNVVYTPAHDFFGTDTLQYTATGPGGTSTPATVTITVAAGAVPTVIAHKASVLAGKPVTIAGADGATNGPFTSAAVVGAPSSGSVQVQGTDFIYTPASDASGDITFTYTLTNAFGASQPATITVTVNPLPVAPPVSATALAGRNVRVNVSAGARGGPFTGASVVSVSPSNAGTATIESAADGYVLVFNAASTFGGVVQIGYTLSNAYATSAPGFVSVTVTARPDPSKDPEVLGVLSAQADATRRMAVGQISNFQRRLETLHSGGADGFTNGISVASASSTRGRDAYGELRNAQDESSHRYLVQPDAGAPEPQTAATSQHGTLPGDISVWTGGAVNFGKTELGGSSNGTDFTTSGLSFGVDKKFSDKLVVGAGVGYGHDNTDVGNNGSRSAVDSYNVALYGSYRPAESFYTDALVGYQWLSFDSYRHVTDDGNRVTGSRDGKQWFASFSTGYNRVGDNSQLTPYGRFDIARGKLDGYTEHGDDVYSLTYKGQTVNTATATLGVLAQWAAKRDYGTWAPQLRAEFGHDLQGSSSAAMRYADEIDGPLYRATLYRQSRNHTLLGAGIALQTNSGWMLRAEYQNQLDNTSRDNQSILLGVEKKFGP